MREIAPYKTPGGAIRALDNGGRFYNLFARAGDDKVSAAELARAAGVLSSDQRAFLFFEMALMELSAAERARVISRLSPELRMKMSSWRPSVLAPSAIESRGTAGLATIVSGYPVFLQDRTEFRGMIVTVTPTIMLIPIIDQFDVYEVFDTPERQTPRTVIATTRGSKRLDGVHSRFGGVLKELHFDDETGKEHGLYLDASYYTPLP